MADINNTTASIQLLGDRTADNITNTANSVTINTFEGDDTVTNSGERASIVSSGGRNVIDNSGNYSTIRTGMGDSTVLNSVTGRGTLIEVGWGDNLVENLGEYVTVQGGGRDDTLYNGADNVTAKGGSGDDFIHTGDAQNFVYEFDPAFDGHDTIYGFNETSTLKIVNITTATYRRVTVGNNVVVKFDNASITFLNAAGLANLNIQGGTDISSYPVSSNQNLTGTPGNDKLNNVNGSGIVIDALEGNDYVNNPYNEVTILGGADDDTINNNGKFNSISGGAGKDSIRDFMGDHNTIDGGDGNDIIEVWGEKSSILGGDGDDSIYTSGYKSSIDGGAGDDTVDVSGEKVFALGGDGNDKINVTFNDATVIGGKDDDTIKIGDEGLLNPPQHTFIEYNDGDGNDVIEGFNETSTLKIGGTYSTIQSGNDIIFKVGTGSITLKDAANLTKLNIDGIEDSGTTAAPKINPHSVNDGNIIWGTPKKDNLHNIGNGQDVTIDALEDDDYISNHGLRASLNGRAGDDTIVNSNAWDYDDDNNLAYYTPDYSTLEGGDGNDSILNNAEHVTIDGGAGDDILRSYEGASVEIYGGGGDDSIVSTGDDAYIRGGDDNDTIFTESGNAVVSGDKGDDYIQSTGEAASLFGSRGNDTVINYGNNATLDGGVGDDSIYNGGDDVLIEDLAGGQDTIQNYGRNVTINGAYGDKIINGGDTVYIDSGNSDDTIENYGSNTTIKAGAGIDVVQNFASNVTIDADGDDDIINNVTAGSTDPHMTNVKIYGGKGDDVIISNSDNSTLDGGDGDDTLGNFGGQNVVINAGGGDNFISNNALGKNVTITSGDGFDSVQNHSEEVEINTGAGDDSIDNTAEDVTIDAGAGNDYIFDTARKEVTITGGAGDDTIELSHYIRRVYITDFSAGDEIWLEEPIYNFALRDGSLVADSALIGGIDQIADVNNSWRIENGKAICSKQTTAGALLSSDKKKITWSDAAKTEDLFTIDGLKSGLTINADGSIDGLKFDGNKIIVSRNVLSTTEVSVDNGYELVLGSDVPVSTIVPEMWEVSADTGNTSTVTYTGEYTTAGYRIVDGKIKQFAGTTGDGFSIRGLALNLNCNGVSVEGIALNDKEITLSAATLIANGTKASLTGTGYTLALGDDCQKPVTLGERWQVGGTTGYYVSGNKTAGFVLNASKTSISYSMKSLPSVIFSISGLADTMLTAEDLNENITVNGKTITVNAKIVGKNFSVPKGYVAEFAAGNYAGKNFAGGSDKDTVDNHGDNILISGGNGEDSICTDGRGVTIEGGRGNDIIASKTTSGNVYRYATGDGYDIICGYNKNDTIQFTDGTQIGVANFSLKSGSNDLTIKVGTGYILLKDAAIDGNEFIFTDSDGKKIGYWTYWHGNFLDEEDIMHISPHPPVNILNVNLQNLNLLGDAPADLDNADSTDDNSELHVQHVNGSLTKTPLKITGNEEDNSLIGGAGKDTIQGGGGEDTFVGGKGNDLFIHDGGDVTIADYGTGSDKVSLGNALDGFDVNDSDVILNAGTGSVTIKDAVGKKVTVIENGKSTTETYTFDGKTNSAGTSIKLTSSTQSFAANTKLVTIDGGLTNGATISGNEKSNKIFGGDGDDVLIGMGGNDTLFGGAGSDVFIYDSGNDVILDFNGDEDKLVISTGKVSSSSVNSKGDVIFKVGTGFVTVKKLDDEDISDGKTITISDVDGETTCTYFSEKIVSDDGKVTLNSNFKGSSYTADKDIYEVDASAVTKKFAITGNDEDNTITGGKGANLIDGGSGDDLLIGGAGNDTFVTGTGNDIIGDYGDGTDKISLGSAQIKNYSVDDSDVIFYFKDGNSLTVKDTAGEKITLVENGKSVVNIYAEDGMFNTTKTAVTLAANTQIFSAANYSKLTTIDGSAVDGEVEIIGNDRANKIFAGDFGSTLNGGGGNDLLWGGDGSDTFIYNPGDGRDKIYDFGAEDQLQIGEDFDAVLKNNSVVFKVGTTSNAITLKDFSGTEFVANDDTYQLNGSKFEKK